ncbi:hypothetical protein Poli38472_010372 [Pythium oligandrum]|uniref:Transmembrane protein n=1 Tax=Pythium oligandrum TaxID=41045 RepID=A0A8K1C302_PYTOL|nr:hypothetical protein Poli38472_010372 [Pythium oligandrum]|eukprot:TMW55490.1 hypothetical protein Poli38472_010372 [Pythium oligandrum]
MPTMLPPRLSTAATTRTYEFQQMYEVGVRALPPPINLMDTPASRLMSRRHHRRFMKWIRTRFHYFSILNRFSMIFIFATWATPREIGRVITPIVAFGCFPVAALTILLMNDTILRLVLRQHEFWFFTLTNTLNWIIASVLFNDTRILGCLACFAIAELIVLMDANFRTAVNAQRSSLLMVPAILSIILVCATRLVDIDPERFHLLIPDNKIDFSLANSFFNNNLTLVIFVIRKTYGRRHLFTKAFLEDRIIPCGVVRCDLVLKRMQASNRDGRIRFESFKALAAKTNNKENMECELNLPSEPPILGADPSQVIQVEPSDPIFAPVTIRPRRASVTEEIARLITPRGPVSTNANEVPHVTPRPVTQSTILQSSVMTNGRFRSSPEMKGGTSQNMRIITPTLAFLDLRHTLVPSWTPKRRISFFTAVLLYGIGLIGLLLAGFTMYLPAAHSTTDESTISSVPFLFGAITWSAETLQWFSLASFLCTTAFFVPFAVCFQRNLLRALSRSFECMFSSFQFTLGCVCLADMLQWDYRCLALLSWLQWFHWVLLWDALLPVTRDRFRFKKRYGTPVLLGIFLGLLWIIYSLFFSSYDALRDRVITSIQWGSFRVSLRTSTFLVGRLSTIVIWSLRLVYKALRSQEDELVFIRGTLEYHAHMEFFPVATTSKGIHSAVVASMPTHVAVESESDGPDT